MTDFASRLLSWQRRHGRHDLPWQESRDPYRVWLSEIMLQQTQVATVIPYYRRFLERFPDIHSLAGADLDRVMACWSGLGYYSRARHLHRAARVIVERHGGAFPSDFRQILALPGVGRSTAAAVSVFAFGAGQAILDGNVKRVLARCFGIPGYPGESKVEDALWRLAEGLLPETGVEAYTQGLMDLGALVCTRAAPRCPACPVAADCVAARQGRVAEFPAPQPRRVLPGRHTVMLILLHEGEVFLEKRPPTGVWGGLWSFPEAEPENDLQVLCRRRFGTEVELLGSLKPLSHTFTHFRLHITPQPVRVRQRAGMAAEADGLWLPPEDAAGAAVPAPVRKLLRLLGAG